MLLAFALILQTILPINVEGQNYAYNYTQYGIEDGLPSSETYFAYQDEEGYMWFTTDRGIVKYDGYDFTTFTEADGLAETVNFKIHKDPRGGFITIGKEGKITEYRDGEFSEFLFNDSLAQINISSNYLLSISCVNRDKILLKPVYISTTKTIQFYYEVNRNNGNFKKINKLNLKEKNTTLVYNHLHYIHTKHDSTTKIQEGKLDSLYYYHVTTQTHNYIKIFKLDSLITEYEINNRTMSASIDSENRMWVSEQKRLKYFISYKDSTTQTYVNLPDNIELSSCFEDKYENIWLTTINDGIIKLNISNFIKSHPIKGLNFRISYLYHNEPFLKVLSRSYIDRYYYYFKDSLIYSWVDSNLYFFNNDSLHYFSKIQSNYIGDIDSAYAQIFSNPFYRPIINITSNSKITAAEFKNKILLKGYTNESLIQLETPYVYDLEMVQNELFVATSNGLYTYSISIPFNTIPDTIYLKDRINDIDYSNPEVIWFGTLKSGLFIKSNKTITKVVNPYHQYTSVNAIEVTNDSTAYIGTSKGLYRVKYKIHNDSVRVLKSNSLDDNEGLKSSYISGIQSYSNYIYVGTLKGLYYFNSSDFTTNTNKPDIHISKFHLIENDSLIENFKNPVKLKSRYNAIQIEYRGLYYAIENDPNFYRYYLHKGDKSPTWQYTNNRSILFSGLAPGEYTFTVQCRNNSNIWSDPATVNFSIAPHYTQTWLFRIGVFLILATGIGAFFYMRNQRLQREQELKNEILSVKMQSTRSQMNPHFVFNGMNAIQNFIFKDEKRLANRYISTFSSLIRDSLKMSEMDYISLDRETKFVEKYLALEKERFPDKFDFEVKVESPVSPEKILVPPLMVQTLAENSVKHAFKGMESKGKVEITYKYDNIKHLLYITVADNGIGLDYIKHKQEAIDDKFGLNLLQRRLNIYNQKSTRNTKAKMMIENLDEINQTGTLITLIIPLNGNND